MPLARNDDVNAALTSILSAPVANDNHPPLTLEQARKLMRFVQQA